MAAIRVIVILFALSPIFVGLTIGAIYWLRDRPRQQQNRSQAQADDNALLTLPAPSSK